MGAITNELSIYAGRKRDRTFTKRIIVVSLEHKFIFPGQKKKLGGHPSGQWLRLCAPNATDGVLSWSGN